MKSYAAARTFFSILSFISWIMIIGGAIYFLTALSALNDINRGRFGVGNLAAAGLIDGPWFMFMGFMGLVFDQIGRAGVDTAETSQQQLKVSRDQLEISKQALRQGGSLEKGYAALLAAKGEAGEPLAPPKDASTNPQGGYARRPDKTAAVASTAAEPLVVPEHQPGDLIEYRTKLIRVEAGGYQFASRLHDTFEAAAARVDTNTHLPPRSPDEPKVVTDRYAAVAQGGEASRIEPPLRKPVAKTDANHSPDGTTDGLKRSPSLGGLDRS